jgi:hypothetical protein
LKSVISKFDNAYLLQQDRKTAPHIPVILLLSKKTLHSMLQHFPFVYLKPDNSCQGKGLFRVDRLDQQNYRLRSRDHDLVKEEYNQLDSLWHKIKQLKMKRKYIIQEGINSVTAAGHLFDIRVHLMRLHGVWEVVGTVARLAPHHRIVTNTYSGGESKEINHLLTAHLNFRDTQVQTMKKHLSDLSLQASKIISASYPDWPEFGLDIGIDQQQQQWIYEINIKPGLLVFKNLDRDEFHRLSNLRKQAI